MRKFMLLAAVLFVAAIPARAQSDYPAVEVFGGYSFNSSKIAGEYEKLHGWGAGFSANLGENWGLASDFSGHYGSFPPLSIVKVTITKYYFLFGPRYTRRGKAATAFAHVLVGGAKLKIEDTTVSSTGFALGVGGGVDVNVGKSFALRVFQIDYTPDRSTGEWESNFRAQFGLVFKFGQ